MVVGVGLDTVGVGLNTVGVGLDMVEVGLDMVGGFGKTMVVLVVQGIVVVVDLQ